jgi:hypothetical protein
VSDGVSLLNDLSGFIRRFVALTRAQSDVCSLWVAHTQALDAADTTPYLNVSSAEKQCGKTLLLEVLSLLVAKPWLTGSASRAVLVRKIEAQQPTLLLDESDAAFSGDRDYAEALRGVLNSGHSRGGVVSLCVGMGANISYKDFSVFCPKAIAGIGKLPDTVADRSIPIRMKRRAPHEKVERFRRRLCEADGETMRERLTRWLAPNLQTLRCARPQLPYFLSDRQQDGCEPLLAIGDLAGDDWPERARAALVEIMGGEAAEDTSVRVRLLSDIQTVFSQQDSERIFTADLLAALCDLEPQWLESNYGKPLTAAYLARLLGAFGIAPRKIRIEDRTASGYLRDWFLDAWSRYMPPKLEQMEQGSIYAGETQFSEVEQGASVPAVQCGESPTKTRVVPVVPLYRTEEKQSGRPCYIHGPNADWWESPPGSGNWLCSKCHPKVSVPSECKAPQKARVPIARELGFSVEDQPWSSGK